MIRDTFTLIRWHDFKMNNVISQSFSELKSYKLSYVHNKICTLTTVDLDIEPGRKPKVSIP